MVAFKGWPGSVRWLQGAARIIIDVIMASARRAFPPLNPPLPKLGTAGLGLMSVSGHSTHSWESGFLTKAAWTANRFNALNRSVGTGRADADTEGASFAEGQALSTAPLLGTPYRSITELHLEVHLPASIVSRSRLVVCQALLVYLYHCQEE